MKAGTLSRAAPVLMLLLGLAGCAPETASDVELERKIQSLQQDITKSEAEAAKFGNGLIRAEIEQRTEIMKTTKAMLEQKRESMLRGIDLVYSVNGVAQAPASKQELAAIREDLARIDARIRDAHETAEQYGGLWHAMGLSVVAVAEVTRSLVEQRYYARKYGMALPAAADNPGEQGGGDGGSRGEGRLL